MKWIIVVAALYFLIKYNPETAKYNVWFSYSDGVQENIGVATGLSECQSLAFGNAKTKKIANGEWSYICCKKIGDNECVTKER